MKKINTLLVIAGLFVCFVMVYLMKTGVHLKERPMVKWSQVTSATEAGVKIARFMYPITQQFSEINILGESPFAESFRESFSKKAKENHSQIKVNSHKESKNSFIVKVMNIEEVDEQAPCQPMSDQCIAQKALKLYKKKKRKSEKTWVSMYRVGENQSLLLFRSF